jgi:hypothetical protein
VLGGALASDGKTATLLVARDPQRRLVTFSLGTAQLATPTSAQDTIEA